MKRFNVLYRSSTKAGFILLIIITALVAIAPLCYATQSPDGPDTTPNPQKAWDSGGEIDNVNNGTEGEWILVTPYDKKERDGKYIEEKLIDGYNQLKSAETPAELVDRGDMAAMAKEASGHDVDPDDMVVRDLFNLTGSEDVEFPLKVKYELKLGEGEWVVLIHYLGDKKWEVMDNDCVVNNEDGTITVTTYEYGLYAFVTEKVPTANKQLDGFNWLWIIIIAIIVIAGLIIYAFIRRRKNGQREEIH